MAKEFTSKCTVIVLEEFMQSNRQYGQPIFLEGAEESESARPLERVTLTKKDVQEGRYKEAWLQRLIMRHPSLLPIDQIEPGFNPLMPVCLELPVRSGSLDLLFVTPRGDLALIECKLWRNPQARREVVAQIIDYAKDLSNWTYEDLEHAISRTKSLDPSGSVTPRSLYDLACAENELDEASFHDAVSRNLKRGRFLLLIVGDGIREGVEAMAEFLQQHAGFHFTLGIVELAIYKVRGGRVVLPRVIVKTSNISRGVVSLEEGRILIQAPELAQTGLSTPRPTSLTEEAYYEELEAHCPGAAKALKEFINEIAHPKMRAEFGNRTLILRWETEEGREWNLTTIARNGDVLTGWLGDKAVKSGLDELYKDYLANLARVVPESYVKETPKVTGWYLAIKNKPLKVNELLSDETRRKGWIEALEKLQESLSASSA